MIAERRDDMVFFKWSILFSFIIHLILFFTFIFSQSIFKSSSKEPIYYVSLMSLPGGVGGGMKKISPPAGKSLRELTKFKAEETKTKLRYPESKKKRVRKVDGKKKTIINKPQTISGKRTINKEGELTTGIGVGGSGIGVGFGEGANLSSFPYTYYVLLIRDKVSDNWYTSLISSAISGTVRAVVYFRILRNGQITDLKIEESSGIKSFDLSALRAIYSAAPFPPLPSGFEGEYLGVHFIFEHSK